MPVCSTRRGELFATLTVAMLKKAAAAAHRVSSRRRGKQAPPSVPRPSVPPLARSLARPLGCSGGGGSDRRAGIIFLLLQRRPPLAPSLGGGGVRAFNDVADGLQLFSTCSLKAWGWWFGQVEEVDDITCESSPTTKRRMLHF